MAGLKKRELANCYYEKFLLFGGMEYYSLKEDHKAGPFMDLLDRAAEALLEEGKEEPVKELSLARDELMERTDILTSYVDKLSVYQYVLNRIELRFSDEIEPIEEETFLQKTMQYIFSTRDNMIINELIKEIIGQLPVRMTKAKYFERLENGLSVYKGADSSSLKSMLYTLRTSAMLYHPKREGQYYKEHGALLSKLQETDFASITKEEHGRLEKVLETAGEELMAEIDQCMLYMEAVNHFYGAFLVKPMTQQAVEPIVDSCLASVFAGDLGKAEGELRRLEGRQERLMEKEPVLEQGLFGAALEEEGVKELLMAQALGSDSLFMELDLETQDTVVDQAMAVEETQQLIKELKELFSQNPMAVNRAVMANTLSRLPVFFESSQEVMEYIQNSLEQCHDLAEKTMSMKLIYRMMED